MSVGLMIYSVFRTLFAIFHYLTLKSFVNSKPPGRKLVRVAFRKKSADFEDCPYEIDHLPNFT